MKKGVISEAPSFSLMKDKSFFITPPAVCLQKFVKADKKGVIIP